MTSKKSQASMLEPAYWAKACRHLAKHDPILKAMIRTYRGELLMSRGSAFYSLARAIVGQQISVKAAESVWNRFAGLFDGEISPEAILDYDETTLRSVGLSGQKARYMKELSLFFVAWGDYAWHEQIDADIITDLLSIKGIGRWTAEMFLIFHLLRPDIFPVADIGLRKAMEKNYNGGKPLTIPEMHQISEPWIPYRTVATWYLWRSLDPVVVAY